MPNFTGAVPPDIPREMTGPTRASNDNANHNSRRKATKLVYDTPEEWTRLASGNALERLAVPRAPNDREQALVLIEVVPSTAGGSAETAIVGDWRQRLSGPGGGPIPDGAFRSEAIELGSLSAVLVEARGCLTRALGAPPSCDAMLLGAAVTGEGRAWRVQLDGPQASVAAQREAFLAFVRSMRLE